MSTTTSQAKIVISADDRASSTIRGVRTSMDAATTSAQGLAGAAGLIGPALAAIGTATAFTAYIVNVTKGVDALNDLSDASGSSIENLSALEDVARRNGGTLDNVAGILVKFNKALTEADGKNGVSLALRAIGVDAQALKALDPAEALRQTAVALANFADDGEKARIVGELFGKSVREAGPFLKDLAEQGRLNATVTTAQAKAAEQFNKNLYELQTNASNAARALTAEMVPALNAMFEKWRSLQAAGGFWSLFGKEFSAEAQSLRLSLLTTDIAALTDQLTRATPGSSSANTLTALLADARKKYDELSRSAAAANEVVKASVGQGLPTAGAGAGAGDGAPKPRIARVAPPPTGKTEAAKIDETTLALAAYVAQLDKELIKVEDLTTQQEALLQLKRMGALGEVPQVRELVLELARRVQVGRDQVETEKAITAEIERQAKARQTLDEAIDRFSGRTADALKQAQTARLEEQLALGMAYSPEELDRIVKGIAGIAEVTKETTDTMDEMLKQFARNAQDALGDTIEATLKGNFSSIGQLWGNLLTKMASQAIAAQLGQTLFGDFAKDGNFGGLVGQAIGFFTGAPGKAGGGPVLPYSVQQVNEKGFEVFSTGGRDYLMTGGAGGRVTPAGAPSAAPPAPASKIIHIANHFALSGAADARTQQQISTAAGLGVQRALARNA